MCKQINKGKRDELLIQVTREGTFTKKFVIPKSLSICIIMDRVVNSRGRESVVLFVSYIFPVHFMILERDSIRLNHD